MLYSSYATTEDLQYALMLIIVIVVTLTLLFSKLVNEDNSMKAIDSFEDKNQKMFSKDILCCWDFSLSTEVQISEYKGEIGKIIF